MNKKIQSSALALGLVLASSFVYMACDDSSSAVKEPVPDSGAGPAPGDSGPGPVGSDAGKNDDGGPKDCFDNPKTHFEIINACTNATRITKNPTLTKLLSDGGLPDLN